MTKELFMYGTALLDDDFRVLCYLLWKVPYHMLEITRFNISEDRQLSIWLKLENEMS